DPRGRAPKKAELGGGQLDHQRIDLVEDVQVSEPAVGGDGPGPEADHAHCDGAVPLRALDRKSRARVASVVRDGIEPMPRRQELSAVLDATVDEYPKRPRVVRHRLVLYLDSAVEIAGGQTVVRQLLQGVTDDVDTDADRRERRHDEQRV